MRNSKFVLSPSGRSWTTTRHTMLAATYSCPIIPMPDCETVDMNFNDLNNVISYSMLRYLNESDRFKEVLSLKDKLMYLNESEAERISDRWRRKYIQIIQLSRELSISLIQSQNICNSMPDFF